MMLVMKQKRVAIYLRVSTNDQNCDLQRSELEKYIESRGWHVHHIYEDVGTGTNGNRPALKQLLLDARSRKFDTLICWKLDRLFRSLKDVVLTLQELDELGIEFISLKDNLDFSTSTGKLLFHVIAAFGEFEASIIRERVKAGLETARKKGKTLGRPKTRDDAKILQLSRSGLSQRKIAAQLGISKGSVQKALDAAGPKTS